MSPCLASRPPPGPATLVCPTGLGRVLAGVLFRYRALESAKSPPSTPKDCRIPAPPPAGAAPGAASAGRVLARRRREPKQVWGDGNHGQGWPDPYLPSSSPFPSRLPPRGPGLAWEPGSVGRLGRDAGSQSRPRVRVPRVPGVSTCPHGRSSGKGRRGDPATRGRGGRLVVIYARADSRSGVASAAPWDRAWGLGKPEGWGSVDAGAAAGSRRPPAPRGDQFRAAAAAEEGRGRRDSQTDVVSTSGCPGELFQQAGGGRYFEWQATPFLTPGICGVPTALWRA